jgi:GntR family transcriptional regulator
MRFWITKNSELPVREQLVHQVMLGILSEDLPPGHKLPSVRALARRHQIHANTVSAAYHDLVQHGWLEMRRGSGLYVRNPRTAANDSAGLGHLLTELLQAARVLGYEPDEVLRDLEQRVRPRTYQHLLVIESEPQMREILQFELSQHLSIPVETSASVAIIEAAKAGQTVVVALPTHAAEIRRHVPDGAFLLPLRLQPARKALEGRTKPASDIVVSVASSSPEVRRWARAMLIAVGVQPEALSMMDAAETGWQDRIGRNTLVIADMVTARAVPSHCRVEVFRVISDSSLLQLRELFRASDCDTQVK